MIGTSQGDTFEDEGHYAAYQWDPKTYAPTESKNTTTPGGPTEPAGALKSSGGTSAANVEKEENDYDYDSWQKANPGVQMAPGQHYPDTYKLPNHMTFSNESIYHNNENQGGQWGTDEQGKDTFTPGPANLEHHSMKDLRDYFQKVEPDAKLLMPKLGMINFDTDFNKQFEGNQATPDKNAGYTPPPLSLLNVIRAVGGKSLPEHIQDFADKFKGPGDALAGDLDPNSEEGQRRIFGMATSMVFGPASIGLKTEGSLGSFAGVMSKTADKGALDAAKAAEKEGIHPDEILQKTGWAKGADDQWRYEIPDNKAPLNNKGIIHTITPGYAQTGPGQFNVSGSEDLHTVSIKPPKKDLFGQLVPGTVTKLPDVLDHPQLFEAYPEFNHTKVLPMPEDLKAIGMAEPFSNTIYLKNDLDPEYARGTLLHEMQHMVQVKEGFSRGGSADEFMMEHSIPSERATEMYKRLQGETEARNVQTRRNMTDKQLAEQSPRSTEDRPRFVQIPANSTGPARLRAMNSESSNVTNFRRAANDNLTADEQRASEGQLPDAFDYEAHWNNFTKASERSKEIWSDIDKLDSIQKTRDWSDLEKFKYNKLMKELDTIFPDKK